MSKEYVGILIAVAHQLRRRFFGVSVAALFWVLAFNPAIAKPNVGKPPPNCASFQHDWTPIERKVWQLLCAKGSASSSSFAHTPHIGANFIRMILTEEPYATRIDSAGLRMDGIVISGPLKLTGAVIIPPIFFTNCLFQNIVDLSDSSFRGTVSFAGTYLLGGIAARRAEFAGSLILGSVDQDSLNIERPPTNNVAIAFIDAASTRVDGNLSIMSASLGGAINIPYSTIKGMLDIESVIGYGLSASASKIDGQVEIVGSDFSPNMKTIDGKYVPSYVYMFEVKAGEGMYFDRSTFDHLYLKGASVSGAVELLGTSVHSLDLSDASIGGDLNIGYHNRSFNVTSWTGESELILTRANLSAIKAPKNVLYWPKHIDFSGFTLGAYLVDFLVPSNRLGRMGGGTREEVETSRVTAGPIGLDCKARFDCPMKADASRWSANQDSRDFFPEWLARLPDAGFAPQPYRQVAAALEAVGEHDAAMEVGYAGRDREFRKACKSGDIFRCALLGFSKATIGYGYHIGRAFVLSFLFIILGAVIFRRTPEAAEANMPIGLTYSFDLFLPLIKLKESNYKIEIKNNVRYYFYFHKLAGWFLGSFVVAGLSGLTQ
ncbi:hypothetical protein [Paraburkholderia sp. JPY419]|uniref:hypothetical protein n=1 Tax=Paraburkholderia sp. JPY419 TaxID=667660 RepID=UPI003D2343DE